MASTRLSAAVGYPGSSVAFAQLLSGMERSGLIKREVRGKRTYRISLGLVQALGVAEADEPPGPDGLAGSDGSDGLAGIGTMGGAGTGGFDYDELARRLLVQVVRSLGGWPRPSRGPGRRKAGGGVLRGGGPARGRNTASWPRRTSGCGNSSRPRDIRWSWPPNASASCPSPPILTAARSCCCSSCFRPVLLGVLGVLGVLAATPTRGACSARGGCRRGKPWPRCR